MDNQVQWVYRSLTSTISHSQCMQTFYGYLHHLQSLYDCFLPFVTLTYLLWLLPTIYNYLLYPINFNFQAYLISITSFKQLPSCGNKMCPTPEVKQIIHILSFKKKKHKTTMKIQQKFRYELLSLTFYHFLMQVNTNRIIGNPSTIFHCTNQNTI